MRLRNVCVLSNLWRRSPRRVPTAELRSQGLAFARSISCLTVFNGMDGCVLRQFGHEVLAMEDMIAGSVAPVARNN